jgi:hypothetical protein
MRCLVVISAALVTALVFASVAWARPEAAPSSPPIAYRQSCLPDGTVRVTFGWTPYHDFQWLDLSLADNGFAPGTYVSVGPMILVSSSASFTWDGIASGRLHVARVNTQTVHGWEPSQTSRFVTRTCWTSSAAQLASVSPDQCNAMTFQWAPANPEGQVQWIDLSTANNGFAPDTYVHAGPFSGDVSGFYWTGLQPGTRHHWRVNTWTGSRWISSATGSFSTPAAQPATPADAERILGAAVRTIKGRDLPVFVMEEVTGPPFSSYWVDQAIALGGRAYFGTYDGCLNRIIVVQAPGGDGTLMELVEQTTEPPATWSQAQAQLKQLFPGADPAFDRRSGTGNTAYLFHDEGATISYFVLAGWRLAAVIAASGSYKHLTPCALLLTGGQKACS